MISMKEMVSIYTLRFSKNKNKTRNQEQAKNNFKQNMI